MQCTKIFRNRLRIISFAVCIIVFNNEFLSHTLQRSLLWPCIPCKESHECVRILFVADPQIIGEQFELPFPIGSLARWDCDRYLQNTFAGAVAHLKPDAIIFLGDLMDEGSVATEEEYERYRRRFFSIFHTSQNIQSIYNPGDNDIGGEDDMITEAKLQRYKQSFDQPNQINVKNITVYKVCYEGEKAETVGSRKIRQEKRFPNLTIAKYICFVMVSINGQQSRWLILEREVNRLVYTLPKLEPNSKAISSKTSIVVTHMPLLHAPNKFVKKVIRELQPQIIFSAHEHKSLHTTINTSKLNDDSIMEALLPRNGPVWKFYFEADVIHEVMVPTCSYRMGVLLVGYGAAVFDLTDNTVLYTVFWLPYRLYQLLIYALLLCPIMLMFSCTLINKICRGVKNGLKSCRLSDIAYRKI